MSFIQLKARTPSGERRFWTIKEIVQGQPLGHPSHPMFVHFPVAFYIAILVFDVASRFGDFQEAPVAATWLIIGAFIATAFAVTTGLVDWSGMARGSTRKRWATRHMIFQLLAFSMFVVNLILRWPDRQLPQAEVTWIVLDVVGVSFMMIGQYLGGILVYRFGMRVSTGQDAGSS